MRFMLAKLNPLNWFSSESKTETDYQARPARAGNPRQSQTYVYEVQDESRIEDPKSPINTGEYRYAGVHEMSDPMYAYKAVEEGVARLIIPRGANVVVPDTPHPLREKKLRAGEVYVDKIINSRAGSIMERACDRSIRGAYQYHTGKKQIPRGGHMDFSAAVQCAAGLHFFVEPSRAISYYNRNGSGASLRASEVVEEITPNG